MIWVARNVVESLLERGKPFSQSPTMEAGRAMPGYQRYQDAILNQVSERREASDTAQTPNNAASED